MLWYDCAKGMSQLCRALVTTVPRPWHNYDNALAQLCTTYGTIQIKQYYFHSPPFRKQESGNSNTKSKLTIKAIVSLLSVYYQVIVSLLSVDYQ